MTPRKLRDLERWRYEVEYRDYRTMGFRPIRKLRDMERWKMRREMQTWLHNEWLFMRNLP